MNSQSLAGIDRRAKLERWARFLRAQSGEELDELAREDAMMMTAKDALQELSSDPTAQQLARERETSVLMHRHLINSSLEQGRVEGRAEGRVEGLVVAVSLACDMIGIEIDAAKKHRLSTLTCEQLTTLVQKLKTERRWPVGF